MSPDREREFSELHSFVDFYATNVKGIDPSSPIHPSNAGKEIVAKFGRSKALEGLRQAVNDTLEELADKPAEYIALLDAALNDANIRTSSELRRGYASSYRRVVKRGSIRNETEYHMIHGVVVDLGNSASAEERESLQRMLETFESQTPNPAFTRTPGGTA